MLLLCYPGAKPSQRVMRVATEHDGQGEFSYLILAGAYSEDEQADGSEGHAGVTTTIEYILT